MSIKEKQVRLPTLYWLPKLHKRPYKARFIVNSRSCTTTVLSKLLTSCLTAVKKNIGLDTMILFKKETELTIFGQLNIQMMFSINFNLKTFRLLNCLHMIFLHFILRFLHCISYKDNFNDLINRTFIRENTQYLACNEECAFFTSDVYNNHTLWSCQKVCDALVTLLDNIFIIGKLLIFRWELIVLFLLQICFLFDMRDFMKSRSREYQANIIEAFNSTSRYLDDLLKTDNLYFDQMVDRTYPAELQLNKANSSEALFFNLNLCISNVTVSTKIYDKRDDFDFDIVNFPFLDGDVSVEPHMWYTYLIRFARDSSYLSDFNYRNKVLTAKLLRQGYRYFKLRKAFSKFYRRHSALVEKYSVILKTLLQQGMSEPEFYGDLVYRLKKL